MSVSKTQIGSFELFSVEAGRFRLDGGAMFGVVPKTLWERKMPADDKNRIPMAMRCLLIKSENTGRIYLIDNGAGTKFDEKMIEIYQIDNSRNGLTGSLEACGVSPEEVTDLVFTHLHFDHCGGTTYYDENGKLQHQFPNARYWVNRRHLESALNPNAREKASFLKDNIQPISQWEKLQPVDDKHEFEEGFFTLPADGHTAGQQLPVIEADGKRIVYAADLIPTYAHIPLPWVMGYDMAPVQTLKEKEKFLRRAAAQGWHVFMEHDASHEVLTINESDGRYSMGESLQLGDL